MLERPNKSGRRNIHWMAQVIRLYGHDPIVLQPQSKDTLTDVWECASEAGWMQMLVKRGWFYADSEAGKGFIFLHLW